MRSFQIDSSNSSESRSKGSIVNRAGLQINNSNSSNSGNDFE
jgi:hypothetical protein